MELFFTKTMVVKTPTRANHTDSGIDFYIPDSLQCIQLVGEKGELINTFKRSEDGFIIQPGQSVMIDLGIRVQLPEGYDMVFHNRSSVASKKSLIVGACVIDNGYRGELKLNLINVGTMPMLVNNGEKIVQGVLRKYTDVYLIECADISNNTSRADGGFGSSD